MALFGPAWQALMAEQVPLPVLPSAIALNGVSYNRAQLQPGDRRRHRFIGQRNGAYGWSPTRDIFQPELWTERYPCPTWHDYLRQHGRRPQVAISGPGVSAATG